MAFFFRGTHQQPPPPPPPAAAPTYLPPPANVPTYNYPPPPPPTMNGVIQSALASYISRSQAADDSGETAERGSLVAVANSIKRCVSGMSPWDISDLTLGLYKIATRHALEGSSDSIDGSLVSDRKELEDLSYWLEWAWASYLGDESSILDFLKIEGLEMIKHVNKSSITKPAYFVAVDNVKKSVVLSVRGTYAATDVLTDLQPHSEEFEGGYAHSGILSAARWIMDNETDNLKALLYDNRGYKLVLTGHSLGAGAACLLSFLLYEHVDDNISSRLKIPISMIECWGFGCPPCVDKLISEHAPFIRNVVLQDDIVSRVSIAALEDLRHEILQTDWDHVLEDGGIAKRMISLVKNTNSRLGNFEKALGYEPGTFFQQAKSIAYGSFIESFKASAGYQRGNFFTPTGHFASPGLARQHMNEPSQGWYGPPAFPPRPQSFMELFSSVGASAISSYLNPVPVPANQMQNSPVNQSSSATTSGISAKSSRLFVPGLLYHIKRSPVTNNMSHVLGGKEDKNSQKEAAGTSSTLMRHNVVKGLNPGSRFTKIILSKSFLSDHSLTAYKDGIKDAVNWIREH